MSGTFIAPGTRAKAAPSLLHGGGHGQHLSAMTRGCLAGTAVCFISNEGDVYPCGYLPVSAGSTRKLPFKDIWNDSSVFQQLRNPDALEGKCGDCRYQALCGGCRARAYAATGSFLAEEPFCTLSAGSRCGSRYVIPLQSGGAVMMKIVALSSFVVRSGVATAAAAAARPRPLRPGTSKRRTPASSPSVISVAGADGTVGVHLNLKTATGHRSSRSSSDRRCSSA